MGGRPAGEVQGGGAADQGAGSAAEGGPGGEEQPGAEEPHAAESLELRYTTLPRGRYSHHGGQSLSPIRVMLKWHYTVFTYGQI